MNFSVNFHPLGLILLLAFSIGYARASAQTAFSLNKQIITTNEWRTASGLHSRRMVATNADTAFTLYRTLCQQTNGQALVCLQYPGVEGFGTPYNVTIYDSKLKITRSGKIIAYQDDTPYCLAEVKSDAANLPEELRGQWLFAVGFWNNHFQEGMRLHYQKTNTVAMIRSEISRLPAEFYFELIHWDDEKGKLKYGAGNLGAASNLEVRWIETGSNILAHARQNSQSLSKFTMPKNLLPAELPTFSPPIPIKPRKAIELSPPSPHSPPSPTP